MSKIQLSDYKPIPAGVYQAVVDGITTETGQFGEQLKFNFALVGQDSSLFGWANPVLNPKSKLYQWVSALENRPEGLPKGYELETQDLIGLPCTLVVVPYTAADGSQKTKLGNLLPATNIGAQQVLPSQAKLNRNAFIKQTSNDMPNIALV